MRSEMGLNVKQLIHFPVRSVHTGRKPLLRQTRAVSRMKSVSESSDVSPVKDEVVKEEDGGTTEDGGTPGDGVQRNLCLEALFQVSTAASVRN